jgi:hypothetical protein
MSEKLLSLGLFVDIKKLYGDLLINCNTLYNTDRVCKHCNGSNNCIIWGWVEGGIFNIICVLLNSIIETIDNVRSNNNLSVV